MGGRRPTAIIFMVLLLLVPMCIASEIPASSAKLGRVSSVVRGAEELNAVINLQYHTQHQHLNVGPMSESGAAADDAADDCQNLSGFQLAHCQRQRFERLLEEDVEEDYTGDPHANENIRIAPVAA